MSNYCGGKSQRMEQTKLGKQEIGTPVQTLLHCLTVDLPQIS